MLDINNEKWIIHFIPIFIYLKYFTKCISVFKNEMLLIVTTMIFIIYVYKVLMDQK